MQGPFRELIIEICDYILLQLPVAFCSLLNLNKQQQVLGHHKALTLWFYFCFTLVSKGIGNICWIWDVYVCSKFTRYNNEGKSGILKGLNTNLDACDLCGIQWQF